MLTLQDIAREAGTSKATVSNVLNNRPGMASAPVRQKVLETARRMGYRPNRLARQLRRQSHRVISVALSSDFAFNNRWRPTLVLTLRIVQGISSYASDQGYHVHLLAPAEDADLAEIRKQCIGENAVDGVILMGLANVAEKDLEKLVAELQQIRVPVVTMDRFLMGLGVPGVNVDIRPGCRQAAELLARSGHRSVAFIGIGDRSVRSHLISRLTALREEFEHAGVSLPEKFVIKTDTELDAYCATRALLDRGDLPTCLVYTGDFMAVAGLRAIRERGLRVPEDISVLSFNNALSARSSEVPLTTIDLKHFEQGRCLATVLLNQVERPESPVPRLTLVASELVERRSVGPAATR